MQAKTQSLKDNVILREGSEDWPPSATIDSHWRQRALPTGFTHAAQDEAMDADVDDEVNRMTPMDSQGCRTLPSERHGKDRSLEDNLLLTSTVFYGFSLLDKIWYARFFPCFRTTPLRTFSFPFHAQLIFSPPSIGLVPTFSFIPMPSDSKPHTPRSSTSCPTLTSELLQLVGYTLRQSTIARARHVGSFTAVRYPTAHHFCPWAARYPTTPPTQLSAVRHGCGSIVCLRDHVVGDVQHDVAWYAAACDVVPLAPAAPPRGVGTEMVNIDTPLPPPHGIESTSCALACIARSHFPPHLHFPVPRHSYSTSGECQLRMDEPRCGTRAFGCVRRTRGAWSVVWKIREGRFFDWALATLSENLWRILRLVVSRDIPTNPLQSFIFISSSISALDGSYTLHILYKTFSRCSSPPLFPLGVGAVNFRRVLRYSRDKVSFAEYPLVNTPSRRLPILHPPPLKWLAKR
ncbi:hypothetical protein K438DRAFT_1991080 [Mycena galopus ATCC 62051]|nr:hypothetical protein K438DRAFT_1991080 [Mycena galopus ATCC 62051]